MEDIKNMWKITAGLAALLITGQLATAIPSAKAEAASTEPLQESKVPLEESNWKQILIYIDSSKVEQDGKAYQAPRPAIVKNGATYVGLRFMAERLGATVTTDSKTKETIFQLGSVELKYKNNSKSYSLNGTAYPLKTAPYTDNNVLMVPLIPFIQSLNIPYTVDNKTITLQRSTKPVASFKVQPQEIVAGETTVTYETNSYSPLGLDLVDERWEGKEEIYGKPGVYSVSYSVQDSEGVWSDPFTLTLKVVKPNEPPVANFTTDKDVYRMGEPIIYTDLSSDDEDAIVDRVWSNQEEAFFTPGSVTISLEVKDRHGALGEFSKTIKIADETLYTREEFYKLFTPVGNKLAVDGYSVKTMEAIPYSYQTEPVTLFRSSGPESISSEGILYQDTITGDARFLLHHKNQLSKPAKLYVLAENPGTSPATVTLNNEAMAGPTSYAEWAGRVSLTRYFEGLLVAKSPQKITLQPGEKRIIWNSINKNPMKPEEIITFTGDLSSDAPVRYTSLLVLANRDPIADLEKLPYLDPNESIVRGTFADSTRVFVYNDPVGARSVKLSLTDNREDPFQQGLDGIKGTEALNSGNYGLVYKLKLNHVAANTLILFNPRGGLFVGSAVVNGEVVTFGHSGKEDISSTASVLYRTGNQEESVEIWISPAAGSNLPFVLLFEPIPKKRN
ncbi:copper amine oxidase N-terminal domain-containing protein [Paenibacillus lutimineralis]|uniref:Copper amine oxidase N-terminal domain-containing protein n=1 Tax=Paenibacillus lutimineralis TaxID=2707005 RepID=A0A3Q9ICK1_9BACL|nr:stalk domain-containing protein [Paenibacillus lutimineralis]AZS17826.1 copper amine oxidase N-terminal domain-containing protein [Paenibacillus lutimineralis]